MKTYLYPPFYIAAIIASTGIVWGLYPSLGLLHALSFALGVSLLIGGATSMLGTIMARYAGTQMQDGPLDVYDYALVKPSLPVTLAEGTALLLIGYGLEPVVGLTPGLLVATGLTSMLAGMLYGFPVIIREASRR